MQKIFGISLLEEIINEVCLIRRNQRLYLISQKVWSSSPIFLRFPGL